MFKSLRSILFLPLVLVAMFGYGQVPAITSFSPASGSVGTLVTINGTNLGAPTAFTIGGQSAIVVLNTGSILVGMVMPGAVTGAVSISTAGGTASGSGNFTVTATNFPSIQQGSKLVGTGNTGTAQQGWSVSLSADGNTVIVGGYQDNANVGAVWIYTRSGGTWVQQGPKLVATGSIGAAEQGISVSLSADGNTALVGGVGDNSGQGAAWIYTRSNGAWTQQGSKLLGAGNVGAAEFGYSVSLSADGNTALVGGWNDNTGTGAAWVYTRSDDTWTQQGSKLVGTGTLGSAEQGISLALSADGNTAIVGGYYDHEFEGAAWIYTRSAGAWAQQGTKLVGSGSVGTSYQGRSVSLSADGNTAIVGGYLDNSGMGSAWVYIRSGDGWNQQGTKLTGTGNAGASQQGFSVSLSADGNTAIVGGPGDNSSTGAAWIYTRSGGVWAQQGSKLVGTGNTGSSYQGVSVSVSADGNTAMIGGYQDNSTEGAAWVYTAPIPTISSFSPATGPPGTLVTINGTNLNNPTAFIIGSQSAIVVSNSGSTLVAMVMPGAVTGAISITTAYGATSGGSNFTITATNIPSAQQGSKLVGSGNIGAANQGYSVALSADGNTAIVGGWQDNFNANGSVGAAWIYVRNGGVWTQQGTKLVGSGNVGGSEQGCSVSLSADGNTALVGGHFDNSQQGAAWVFIRSGGIWSQQGPKLVGTGNTSPAEQGWRVSLSADGNTALIGGLYDNQVEGSFGGAAWIFVRSGGVWTQQGAKLVGSGSIGGAQQGESVSLSADGNTAIVGGATDHSNNGAAWVFTRNGTNWSQQGSKLIGTGNIGTAQLGYSVSLSADGNTAILGGFLDNSEVGAAWIFTRSGSAWSQQGSKLVGTAGVGTSLQGGSVSLSADGNTAIVGGYNDNTGQGAAWVYTRSGSTWIQHGSKLVETGNVGQAEEGFSVSLSADGNTAIIGGEVDNSNQGAAWVYNTLSNASLTTIALTPASTLTNTGTSGSTTTYTTSVGNGVTSVTATPTTNAPTATITVDGIAVTSGTASPSIPLTIGKNTIAVVVTAQDGVTTQTYNIIVGRGTSNASLSTIALTPYSTLTNTGTIGTITTYTTSVSNASASVKVTPTTADHNATVTVNGISVTSGTASGSIALAEGTTTTINTVVTAQDGVTTRTYSIAVTRAPSSNASLSTIALSPYSTLTNTGTKGTTTTYATSVSYTTTVVKVTPATQDPTATVKVNGTTVASGTASAGIPLAVGANTITTVVTAQDGVTTHTYSITVARAAPSNNASLSIIALTPYSTLTNTGTSGNTITYTTTVSNATTSAKVTPTTGDPNATVKVNGIAVTSGTASGAIALGVEGTTTTITTIVTAQDGTTTKTYSIVVTRAPASNASLITIALTPYSTLTNTGTVGTTTSYTTSVSNATTSVKVTPTTSDANAKVNVNGVAVSSGTASASIALAVGQTTITTIVTAQDNVTTKTYSITVTRATGPLMSLYAPVSVVQPAVNLDIENDGVMVHQGISPNSDGINDFLTIDGIIAYPNNSLQIIDRAGAIIFEAKGYNDISNVFDGHSSINGRMQQPGTYFYSLDYVADGHSKHKTGYIILRY